MRIPEFRNIFSTFAADSEGALPASVDFAVSLCDGPDVHLTIRGFGAKVEVPFSIVPAFAGSLAGSANAEARKRLDAADAALRSRLASAGVTADASVAQLPVQDILDGAAFQARLHDLAIVDAPDDVMALGRTLVEELLFSTGRPLICVPETARTCRAGRILVAWDGTSRAARAVHDAMPLLRAADHVELVSVTNEKDLSRLVPGTEITPHLSRHGVKVTVTGIDAPDGDAGAALRARATLTGADMIVMGAFAHSRWRQMVLGGVTDSMFRNAKTPIFMSH